MLEAKLGHNKTENKNVKVEKVEFFKTWDQYHRRCNFGKFFSSVILPPSTPSPHFCWGKNRSWENTVQEEWVISFCLGGNDRKRGENFAWGLWTDSIFWLTNVFAINLTTIMLKLLIMKLFCNHGGIYRFRKKFKKDSGEINPLSVHRNSAKECVSLKSIVKD